MIWCAPALVYVRSACDQIYSNCNRRRCLFYWFPSISVFFLSMQLIYLEHWLKRSYNKMLLENCDCTILKRLNWTANKGCASCWCIFSLPNEFPCPAADYSCECADEDECTKTLRGILTHALKGVPTSIDAAVFSQGRQCFSSLKSKCFPRKFSVMF